MNAFFASVEQAHRPHLRGKPVLISADPYGTPKGARSVAATASYEARSYGVKTGMPLFQALELCPQAVIVEGDAGKYTGISLRFLDILRRFTDLVEPYSIDEAFIDITASAHLFGGKRAVAKKIKELVKKQFGITCSIGVAPNKAAAKIASDLEKPDGLVIIEPHELPESLWHLPVDVIPGVGRKRSLKMNLMGIKTVGDLALAPRENIRRAFGVFGEYLQNCALGMDDSPVIPEEAMEDPKSVSAASTFGTNTADPEEIETALFYLTEKAVFRLKKHRLKAGVVGIWIRYEDFTTAGEETKLTRKIDSFEDIFFRARKLLASYLPPAKPVRLAGIYLGSLERCVFEDIPLFPDQAKKRRIDEVLFAAREKFGRQAVFRARSMLGKNILLS